MTVQGTLGSMLQGVSQQPERIRVDGQVSEQVNMYSDVATGLSSRAGTDLVGILAGADNTLKYYDLELKGSRYILGYKAGTLKAWTTGGSAMNISGDQTYVGNDMRFHVFDDVVYAANRDTVVVTDPAVTGFPFHVALVTALGGNFSRDYKVTIKFSDNSTITSTYTTPDGDVAGDADQTASSYIIEQLRLGFNATQDDGNGNQVPINTIPPGVVIEAAGDVLLVRYTSTMTVTVDDGDAGTVLRAMADIVDDQTDLPKFAPHGTITKVVGDAAEEDDYWLRFNSDTTDVVGDGFGDTGVWEEWYNVTQPNTLDPSTMPHAITLSGVTFTIAEAAWEARRVGDEDSNPFPSFVGNAIRDIGGFESRLVFVAGPNVVMSRTREPLDFFRKSATVLVDSDPIDMKSTKEGSATLDWIVPFDRDLILLSDPGDSQFVVTGGGITPENASLVLTTSYEMFGLSRPVTTGRTLVFPFKSGAYSGIKEFFTNDTVSTNGADTLTEVQNRYIPGNVTGMASSKNFNLLLITTDATDATNTVWTYKYLWDGTNRLQSSWSQWIMPDAVLKCFFDNSVVYFVLDTVDGVTLSKLDMNRPIDATLDYHPCMDNKDVVSTIANKVTLSYSGATFVQYTGAPNEGIEIKPDLVLTTETGYDYYFYSLPEGTQLLAGKRFSRYIDPTMPRLKDRNGATISSAKLTIIKFMLHIEDSGEIDVTLRSPYRQDYTFKPYRYPLDDEPTDPNRSMLTSGVIDVPWGERADLSSMRISSDDVRPTTILELEWQAQVTGSRRRV